MKLRAAFPVLCRLPRLAVALCVGGSSVLWARAADVSPVALAKGDGARDFVANKLAADYPALDALYKHLHTHPELSLMEEKTAARLAAELRAVGYAVTEKFGGTGIVGVLSNGPGPVLYIRTDLDGLPITEETGLPYASTTRVTNLAGQEVSVMQGCGHDIHMTVFTGTARMLAAMKDRWSGTVVFIGQPAEEIGVGARAMLAEGLYRKFPKPDYVVAVHDSASLPAGTVGILEGYVMANVDSVDITVRGRGGHGAYPHATIDPVVLAARIVLTLQTIVSRETRPVEPAVVTVGSIHGGTKHNIIPNEVKLQLTLRSYSDAVRQHTIAAIRRICRGEAIAAGLPDDLMPVITIKEDEFTPATYNDPALTRRVRGSLVNWLGADNVTAIDPEMGGEDFSQFGRTTEKVPICLFRVGAVDPALVAESKRTGVPLPSLHSSKFAPLPEPTIKTGVTALTAAALDLLAKK
jgi:amidohydrolase